jgi:NAD(P)-dependent dehydrogenase (short-subunit alcohol dehydrogenase family)
MPAKSPPWLLRAKSVYTSPRERTQLTHPKVLIITGASRGIGAATARLAAQRGYAVCVNYRSARRHAESLVAELEASGALAIAVAADVSVEADVVRLFETCDERLGLLSGLVNNAGILERQMRVEQMDAERLRRVLATNVIGAFVCAREAVLRMSTNRGGRGGAIVNVSSAAARLGSPGEYVDYAASKGALDTLTIGLAQEVAAQGIRVNTVRPAFIATGMHASGGEPNRIDRVKAFVPMKRGGTPEEVAHAILWLLSEEASYTTGAFIEVAGGK